jgi:hypothetical protein
VQRQSRELEQHTPASDIVNEEKHPVIALDPVMGMKAVVFPFRARRPLSLPLKIV